MYKVVVWRDEVRGAMDGDLFRILILALATLGVIGIGVSLATLMAIRQRLDEGAGLGSPPVADLGTPTTEFLTKGTMAAAPAQMSALGGYRPEPQQGVGTATTATPQTTADIPLTTDPTATIRSVLEQHGLGDTAAAGAGHTHRATEQVSADSAFAAHADDPQQEPFQRDGRWWFRRGDELLLYDEASGEWQPAGDNAPSGASTQAAHAAQPTVSAQTAAPPAVADQVATFWKCATCGAVNGSTAATCRMCFAARP